jgi:hypothetical protein
VLSRRGQVLSELPYAARGWEMLGVQTALRRYERRHLRRANAIVTQSFQAGRLAQLSSTRACAVRDVVVRALPDRLAAAQQARFFRARLD